MNIAKGRPTTGVMTTQNAFAPPPDPEVEAKAPKHKEGATIFYTVPTGDVFNTTSAIGTKLSAVAGQISAINQADIDWLMQFVESGKLTLTSKD
jgi:hypothetical protein